MLIALTGATGTVGGHVARLLAPRHRLRCLTRSPERASHLGVPGLAVGADLGDPASLRRALTGADALLVVTFDPLRDVHDAHLLTAARRAGVRHVVKLSALAVTDPRAQDAITRWQRACEERVRASGMSWTLLRPRAFMSNCLSWAETVRDGGVVRTLHGGSRNSCVDPGDVAAAAARALTGREYRGGTYALTGPDPLSAREQVAQLAEVLGRPVRHEELTEAEALRAWRSRYPAELARALLESADRQARGAKCGVHDGVREATGRKPGTFRAWARRHEAAFRTKSVEGAAPPAGVTATPSA
ncbi:butenolide phosphate reductase ScbC [Streptomyces chumphonensis]|uniref:NAD(P)H-binding protein n=1 Tax=Streptomyces chumphonensis TaxID=1214925 RepID=A0A927EZ45_9ACTN|nr:NAD(P)H-binding protein [Streptomyces chumphonensis]MBD3932123.1 NAD(P)H-binding protein [Streptomyces chumphonensis]